MSESTVIPPNSRGAPSADVIKAFWEASPKPSERTVQAAMREQGYDISARSIGRCVASGFAPRAGFTRGGPKSTKTAKSSPETNAIKQVQAVAPDDAPPELVAAALVEAIQNLPDGERDRIKDLIAMDDQQLDTQGGKLVKVARYLLAEDLARHTKMMMLQPDKAAKLLTVLSANIVATAPPIAPAGDNAKLIEHDPAELSASAQALREFRMKRASAAA